MYLSGGVDVGTKTTAKAWRSETFTDVDGKKYKAVTVIKDVVDCDFQKFFAGELLRQIAETDDGLLPMKNFKKVLHIITTLLSLSNRENYIYKTVAEMADLFGVSTPTMKRYLKSFQIMGLIENSGARQWILNSDVFSQVPAGERKDLIIRYRAVKSKKEADKNQRRLFEEEIDEELKAVNE